MTDNEIIKCLECCASEEENACDDCYCANGKCIATTPYVLDLINRQQAEIERWRYQLELVLKERADHSEAIKEFASEFEYEIIHKEFWKDHPHTSQVWLNGYEQCMRDIRVMLKDKIKEMVGEE